MTTIVNAAVNAVVAALSAAPTVCPQIGRVNLLPIAQNAAQYVIVRPLASEVTQASTISSLPVMWTTHIAVECYARAGASTPPDTAVDATLEAVYARLMADPTLGGAVIALQPQHLSYDFDADGINTACATLTLHAKHRATPAALT